MLLRMTIDGTLTLFNPSQLNQGSVSANKVEILAPFASTSVVTLAYRLPNGQATTPVVATLSSASPVISEDNSWNLWSVNMPAPLTQYAGTLGIQVYVTIDGGTLASSLLSVPVNKGVAYVQPQTNIATWDSIATIYNAILTAKTNAETASSDAIAAKNAAVAAKEAAETAEEGAQDARDEAEDAQEAAEDAQEAAEEARDAIINQKGVANGIATLDANGVLSQAQRPDYIPPSQSAVNTALQTEIDNLKAAPDVVDIVATYADLLNYDTQYLTNNDIVKVLSDETHTGMQSYYRWVITASVGAWVYIGSVEAASNPSQLAELMEGDDFISVDLNASDNKVAITLDSTHKPFTVELSGTSGTLTTSQFAEITTSEEAKIVIGDKYFVKEEAHVDTVTPANSKYTFVSVDKNGELIKLSRVVVLNDKTWTLETVASFPENANTGDAMVFNGTEWAKQDGYGFTAPPLAGHELTWDGSTTGREKLYQYSPRYEYYMVTDEVEAFKEDYIGSTVYCLNGPYNVSKVVKSAPFYDVPNVYKLSNPGADIVAQKYSPFVVMQDTTCAGHLYKKGVYFANNIQLPQLYTTKLQVASRSAVIHKFDDKYSQNNNIKNGTGTGSTIANDLANNVASGVNSHAEGQQTTAANTSSHSEGKGGKPHTINILSGRNTNIIYVDDASAAWAYVGASIVMIDDPTHRWIINSIEHVGAPGWKLTLNWELSTLSSVGIVTGASAGVASHSEGLYCTATGDDAHAEGEETCASGDDSHAEGAYTWAKGVQSHAEGNETNAVGDSSHAEGYNTNASGTYSHTEGERTYATHRAQHVFGAYNVHDPSPATGVNRGNYIEIVGNGTGSANRSNARTLDWSGNETLAGNLRAEGLTDGTTTKTMTEVLANELPSGGSAGNLLEKTASGTQWKSPDDITVGKAKQLTSPDGYTDNASFVRRPVAQTMSITTGDAKIKSIKGNTVVWNQLRNSYASGTTYGVTCTPSQDGKSVNISGTVTDNQYGQNSIHSTITFKRDGRKYLITVKNRGGYNIGITGYGNQDVDAFIFSQTASSSWTGSVYLYAVNGTTINLTGVQCNIFDLTTMFGAGNEPATVAEFKAMFPLNYYAYDAGSLKSIKPTGMETVGFNQWDEEWELGGYNSSDGSKQTRTDVIRAKNKIPVLPNTSYNIQNGGSGALYLIDYDINGNFISALGWKSSGVITTGENTYYLVFQCDTTYGTTYNHNICINLSWSGTKNGTYEAYNKRTLAIDTLTYFPNGMRSARGAYDEMDFVRRKAVTRIGAVDLGSLTWTWLPNYSWWQVTVSNVKRPANANTKGIITSAEYSTETYAALTVSGAIGIAIRHDNNVIVVKNGSSTVTPTGTAFYELATPTEVDIPESVSNIYFADDWGTEEWLQDASATPVLPVPCTIEYQRNQSDFIRNIPNMYTEKVMTAQGDLIVGGADGKAQRLGKGTAGQVLKAGANGVEWGNESGGTKLYLHRVDVRIDHEPAGQCSWIDRIGTPRNWNLSGDYGPWALAYRLNAALWTDNFDVSDEYRFVLAENPYNEITEQFDYVTGKFIGIDENEDVYGYVVTIVNPEAFQEGFTDTVTEL